MGTERFVHASEVAAHFDHQIIFSSERNLGSLTSYLERVLIGLLVGYFLFLSNFILTIVKSQIRKFMDN